MGVFPFNVHSTVRSALLTGLAGCAAPGTAIDERPSAAALPGTFAAHTGNQAHERRSGSACARAGACTRAARATGAGLAS
jgi:hypothetical protein